MALSWRVMVASSASLSSSRARCATQRTSSAVSDMTPPGEGRRAEARKCRLYFLTSALRPPPFCLKAGHLEELLLRRPLDAAGADALDAHALAAGGAVVVDLD